MRQCKTCCKAAFISAMSSLRSVQSNDAGRGAPMDRPFPCRLPQVQRYPPVSITRVHAFRCSVVMELRSQGLRPSGSPCSISLRIEDPDTVEDAYTQSACPHIPRRPGLSEQCDAVQKRWIASGEHPKVLAPGTITRWEADLACLSASVTQRSSTQPAGLCAQLLEVFRSSSRLDHRRSWR